jgi:hypothetical protein
MTEQQTEVDEARTAVAGRVAFSLPWLQRHLRLSYQRALDIAETLETEGLIGPEWRRQEKRAALRSYAAAEGARQAYATQSWPGPLDGWANEGEARNAAEAWLRTARRLGVTEEELAAAVLIQEPRAAAGPTG